MSNGRRALTLLQALQRTARWHSDLLDVLRGCPGFLIGNGASRTGLPIEILSGKGVVGVCNRLGEEYPSPHLHVWLDGSYDTRFAAGGQLRAAFSCTSKNNANVWSRALRLPGERPFFFDTRHQIGSAPFVDGFYLSSSGNVLFQLMTLLGCDPIFLIGMDGGYVNNKGNIYEDHLAGMPRMRVAVPPPLLPVIDGVHSSTQSLVTSVETNQRLYEWATELSQMIQTVRASGRRVYRVGTDGVMHGVPSVPWSHVSSLGG